MPRWRRCNMLIQPILIAIKESGDLWEYRGTEKALGADYVYKPYLQSDFTVKIEPGYKMDGASSPKAAWTITGFLPRGIHDPAALVHDKLYEDKGNHNGQTYTRKEADRIFLKMLQLCGVKSWHSRIAYIAVRAGGWYYWNK